MLHPSCNEGSYHTYANAVCVIQAPLPVFPLQILELVIGYNGIKAIINKRTAQFFRVAQEEFLSRPESEEHARLL